VEERKVLVNELMQSVLNQSLQREKKRGTKQEKEEEDVGLNNKFYY